MAFYAVAHHGTKGLGWSYGYAEVVTDEERPRSDITTTIAGPFDTEVEAKQEAAAMEAECENFRASQDNED